MDSECCNPSPCRPLTVLSLLIHPSRPYSLLAKRGLALIACLWAAAAYGSVAPQDWRYEQSLAVPPAGLTATELPLETLDAARPFLEDLRLTDKAGQEVPFLVEQPAPQPPVWAPATSFSVGLEPTRTVVTVVNGGEDPVDGVSLVIPVTRFIKSVGVDGSQDGQTWERLVSGQPLFQFPEGASKLDVLFRGRVWAHLRVILDDERSEPVPVTGLRVRHAPKHAASSIPTTVRVVARDEAPGLTRLAIDLGAANLPIGKLTLQSPEPLFTREVTVAIPEMTAEGITERTLGQAVLHRVELNGVTASQLDIELNRKVPSRQLILLIRNQDSPPLDIAGVVATRYPVRLVFLARSPTSFKLLSGNDQCQAPQYDLANLATRLKAMNAFIVSVSPLAPNPSFRVPEPIPGLEERGASLAIGGWQFRKAVKLGGPGVQQLELDAEVLAHGAKNLGDLRLVRGDRQIPYVVERTSLSRIILPAYQTVNEPKAPTVSTWKVELPYPGLPITRLTLNSHSSLFEREIVVCEEIPDAQGRLVNQELGHATWRRTPDRPAKDLELSLARSPSTKTLFIRTRNGDNPGIELAGVSAFYPVSRLVFKAAPATGPDLELYYGNPAVTAPYYDLSLMAGQLLSFQRSPALLGPEKEGSHTQRTRAGTLDLWQRVLFWTVLSAVVATLLIVLARFVPKAGSPE